MRLLADENFPRSAVQMLRSHGHDVLWIMEETRGIDDRAVLSRATSERRILLTLDKDFDELVYRNKLKAPFGIILFRIPQTIVAVLESRTDWTGHFFVVRDENDIDMRPLPEP